jgi:hypothetical protein
MDGLAKKKHEWSAKFTTGNLPAEDPTRRTPRGSMFWASHKCGNPAADGDDVPDLGGARERGSPRGPPRAAHVEGDGGESPPSNAVRPRCLATGGGLNSRTHAQLGPVPRLRPTVVHSISLKQRCHSAVHRAKPPTPTATSSDFF